MAKKHKDQDNTARNVGIAAVIGGGIAWLLTTYENQSRAIAQTAIDKGKDVLEAITEEPQTIVSVFGPMVPPAPKKAPSGSSRDIDETLGAFLARIGTSFSTTSEGPFAGEQANLHLDSARNAVPAPKLVLLVSDGPVKNINGFAFNQAPGVGTKSAIDQDAGPVVTFDAFLTTGTCNPMTASPPVLIGSVSADTPDAMKTSVTAIYKFADDYRKKLGANQWFVVDLLLRDKDKKVRYVAASTGKRC